MPTQVELLAHDVLDERELRLAAHLSLLLGDPERDAAPLIEEILPIYLEKHGNATRVLTPDSIYRPLYYVHGYAEQREFGRHTQAFIDDICNHLEGCLEWLTPHPPKSRHPSGPFGNLAAQLYKAGTLPRPSADQLARFNKVVNASSKWFTARPVAKSNPAVKAFSTLEAALAFVMMRKLSIQLFGVLKAKGVSLPQGWKDFREEWLSWERARPT
jgi:hypothetical protein